MKTIQENLKVIEKNVQAACQRVNRQRSDVTLIAVTKQVSSDRALEVIEAGVTHLGENRPEGFLTKYEQLGDRASWHFIGNVQSRKVKTFIDQIDVLHSLDRLSIAKEIQKRASQTIDCFVQVNVSGEETKSGLQPNEVANFISTLQSYDKIKVIGLMTMAPFTDQEQTLRKVFRSLRMLRDEIAEKKWTHAPCLYLSMGMSNDYPIAIEEGATHIRIGTALVGKESEGNR